MPAARASIASSLDLRDNALNFLRLLFAAMVIVSHSRPLAGFGNDPHVGRISLGGCAVAGFFAISGFLITGSRLKLRPSAFFVRRFMRIFPAYWLCSVITAFGLTALIGQRRGGWSPSEALHFVISGLGMIGWDGSVGDVLVGAPDASTINGALWTLPLEFVLYMVLSGALAIPAIRHHLRAVSLGGLTLLVAAGVLLGAHGAVSGPVYLMCYFGAGVTFCAWREAIPFSDVLGVAAVVATPVLLMSWSTVLLASVSTAYACLWFGARAPAVIRRIGATNDISYGIYLYGWPVQQTLTAYGAHELGLGWYAALALACAVPLAWISWLAVERPVNRLAHQLTTVSGGTRVRRRTPVLGGRLR